MSAWEGCAPEGARWLWDHGRGTRVGRSKCLRGCGALCLVFLRVRDMWAPWTKGRRKRGDAFRPDHSKEPCERNPMSGSGPSVSARSEGEQPVEGVRNPEDGRCRALDGPGDTDPSAEVAEGARTSRGATRSCRTGEGTLARTLRGWRSLREPPGGLTTARQAEWRKTSWSWKRRGGGGEPMTPLRRAERSERQRNPVRVVPRTATSSWNSPGATETPGEASTDLSVQPSGTTDRKSVV